MNKLDSNRKFVLRKQ